MEDAPLDISFNSCVDPVKNLSDKVTSTKSYISWAQPTIYFSA